MNEHRPLASVLQGIPTQEMKFAIACLKLVIGTRGVVVANNTLLALISEILGPRSSAAQKSGWLD